MNFGTLAVGGISARKPISKWGPHHLWAHYTHTHTQCATTTLGCGAHQLRRNGPTGKNLLIAPLFSNGPPPYLHTQEEIKTLILIRPFAKKKEKTANLSILLLLLFFILYRYAKGAYNNFALIETFFICGLRGERVYFWRNCQLCEDVSIWNFVAWSFIGEKKKIFEGKRQHHTHVVIFPGNFLIRKFRATWILRLWGKKRLSVLGRLLTRKHVLWISLGKLFQGGKKNLFVEDLKSHLKIINNKN